MTKITPEVEQFIRDNCNLSDYAITDLLEKDFKIIVDRKTVDRYLQQARASVAQENNSKVEAVRAQILDRSNLCAAKYLKMLDEEITALDSILKTGSVAFEKSEDRGEESDAPGCLSVETIKDRVAVSQSLQKAVGMILAFVSPADSTKVSIDFKPDYSNFTEEELRDLKLMAVKAVRKKKE